MKKIYGLLLLFFAVVTGHAQIKKGSVLLGGQLSYYNRDNHYSNQPAQGVKNAIIGISAGKAYRENNFAGLEMNYTSLKETSTDSGGDSLTSKGNYFTIGAFIRTYKKLANNLYIFGQATGGVTTGNQIYFYKSPTGEIKETQRGIFVSLTPGVSYQVFKKMQVEITIPGIINMQYVVTKQNSRNTQAEISKYNTFTFNSNVNNTNLGWLGVGFRFVL